ncbi:MAG TPA: hypothetical protein VMN36_09955 [Verrucomicrobiales bacterium]|nr:hypothetical protein [Verrucomicrobiales bacterium]
MTAHSLPFLRRLLPVFLLCLMAQNQAGAGGRPPGNPVAVPFVSQGSAHLDEHSLLSVLAVATGIQESAQLQATDRGRSHPLGQFRSHYDLTVALADPLILRFDGEFISRLADGSTITFAIGVYLSLIDGAFHGSFYPVAGTGRFQEASGNPGDIATSGMADLFSGIFTYRSRGIIEPSSRPDRGDRVRRNPGTLQAPPSEGASSKGRSWLRFRNRTLEPLELSSIIKASSSKVTVALRLPGNTASSPSSSIA